MKWFKAILILAWTISLHAQNSSQAIWAKARELMQQQQYSEAIAELKKAPRSAEQFFWMAFSASMIMELQDAEQYAREAVAFEENWPDSHVLLGDILYLRKKPVEALAEYDIALKLKPSNVEVLLKAARIEKALQRFTDGFRRYKEVLAIDPENVYARLGVAEIFTYQKKWDDARREFNAILKNGKNGDVYIEAKVGLARIHAWTKQFDEAEKLLHEVLSWKPETVIALELLAQVYEWSGNYTKAKRTYETILKWQPGHKEAKNKLVELQWVK